MPLNIDVVSTPYGIPLPNAYGVVTDYTVTPQGGTMTVTLWATQAAYEAGAQPGWTHEFPVNPVGELTSILESLALPGIAAAPGVGSVTQV